MDNSQLNNREAKRKEVFAKLQEDFQLPSPSGTVLEIIRLCNSEDSSLTEIAEIIETDPALSAEIIKYANSAFLSTGVQVASVQKATVKLGMRSVVNLAIGFSMLAENRSGTCEGFDYPRFWRTSLAEALAARELARIGGDFASDELFVCGLLAHIGSLSLATIFPEKYSAILENQPPNNPPRAIEQEAFGIDSGEFTSELFLSWGLPAHYALAAGFHEDLGFVELGSGQTQRAAVYLLLAHTISTLCLSKEAQPELLETIMGIAGQYDVDLDDFSTTFATIVEQWHEHGRLFDITTEECYSYSPDDY